MAAGDASMEPPSEGGEETNNCLIAAPLSRGVAGWLALIFCVLYAILSAVVIGATIRMWVLDYTDELPLKAVQELPLSVNALGWGSLCVSAVLTLVVTWTGIGGLCFEIPPALFNTYLLFKCTERYIVVLAVVLCLLFFVCSWKLGRYQALREAKFKEA